MWESSNPALKTNAFDNYYEGVFGSAAKATATVQGVVTKTAVLVGLAVIAGTFGYSVATTNTAILGLSSILTLVVTLIVYFVIHGKPHTAPYLAPVYAGVEGFFLGALTAVIEHMLAQRGIKAAGGVALQAFVITVSVLVSMLTLYRTGLIKPSRTLMAALGTATLGIMICYLLSWPLALLFHINMPFIGFASALTDQGTAGLIGLGVNVLILLVASFWLIIDFGMIEQKIAGESPKYMEWYCGFVLLVSLAWIYYESVKLVVRLASLMNSRN